MISMKYYSVALQGWYLAFVASRIRRCGRTNQGHQWTANQKSNCCASNCCSSNNLNKKIRPEFSKNQNIAIIHIFCGFVPLSTRRNTIRGLIKGRLLKELVVFQERRGFMGAVFFFDDNNTTVTVRHFRRKVSAQTLIIFVDLL